jgi:hypothetical protein
MKIKHSTIIFSAFFLLFAPLFLFMTFWLSYSIFYWLISLYVLKDFLPFIQKNFTDEIHLPIIPTLCTAVLILSWIIYGGVGKIGYQNFDYVKHNSIYYDLLMNPWPVETQYENQKYYLVYYLGYYLIPAAIGKIFSSFFILEIASIIQAFLAISTILLLITALSKNKNFFFLMFIMIFWAGLDVFGNLIFHQDYSKRFGEFPEWWAGASNFQYTGFTDLLYWVPQHALGGWLTTSLCFIFFQHRFYLYLPLIVSLSLLWSPFVCIGLLPFLVIAFFSHSTFKEKIEWLFSRYGNFALLILAILLSYYSTSSYEQPFKWQFTKMGAQEFIPRYLTFLVLEISLPATFIYYFRKTLSKEMFYLYCGMILFLIITPHIYLGVYSDFAMRGSIAGLFSLFVLSVVVYNQVPNHFKLKMFLSFYIVLTSYSAISDFYRAQKLKHINLDYGPTKVFDPNGISKQYLGLKDSTFFKIFF